MNERLPTLPERKTVRDALRGIGLSSRQVDAVLRGGWGALVGRSQAEAQELREQLESLARDVTGA